MLRHSEQSEITVCGTRLYGSWVDGSMGRAQKSFDEMMKKYGHEAARREVFTPDGRLRPCKKKRVDNQASIVESSRDRRPRDASPTGCGKLA